MKNKTKCYCGHTDYCDCIPLEELKQETLEEAKVMNKKKFLKLQRETITDVDLIPKDTLYCYTPDEERNKNRDSWFTYYIKPCPYLIYGKGNMRGCLHLKGYYTNDPTFRDQCKSCGENYPDFED